MFRFLWGALKLTLRAYYRMRLYDTEMKTLYKSAYKDILKKMKPTLKYLLFKQLFSRHPFRGILSEALFLRPNVAVKAPIESA